MIQSPDLPRQTIVFPLIFHITIFYSPVGAPVAYSTCADGKRIFIDLKKTFEIRQRRFSTAGCPIDSVHKNAKAL
jgi:hypothetical protein